MMKTRYGKYIRIALGSGLLALLFGACSEKLAQPEPSPGFGNGALTLAVKTTGPGTAAENAIRTLRLLVYAADDGSLLLNKQFMTKDALPAAPADTYIYFTGSNGEYTISELLPKKAIRIYVVGNEHKPFDPQPTEAQVHDRQINFYTIYGSGGTMDISVVATDPNSNMGYAPMFVQSKTLQPYQWANSGEAINMRLVRTLAKVTLRLKGGTVTDPLFVPGDKITITSAAIVRIPQYFFVGNPTISNSASLVSTGTHPFATPIEIDGVTDVSTDRLTFYIPEHIISQAYVDNGQYTYIQVNGEYYSHDEGKTIRNVYQIPLGNGVGKLYNAPNPAQITDLTREDLTVSRNMHYDVEAQVASIGKLEGLQVVVNVLDWEGEEQVDGDADAPLLNVSSLAVKMTDTKVRVSFWTNRSDAFVEAVGRKNDAGDITVNTIFRDISGAPGISGGSFHLYANGDDQYYPYNGYIDFEFTDPALNTGVSDTYSVVLNTGGLRRTIRVQANPVLGEVVFDANGGSGSYSYLVRFSDMNGSKVLSGTTISVPNQSGNFTPPAGQTLLGWAYSPTGAPLLTGNGTPTLSVTLTDYTTTVYAWWGTI